MSPLKHTVTNRVLFCVLKNERNPSYYFGRNRYCTASNNNATSTNPPPVHQKAQFVTFDDVLKKRRSEASRSIIVQVKNEKSYYKLFSYLEKFGTTKNSFFYFLAPESNYILTEFESVEALQAALTSGQHLDQDEIVPVRSPLMWFRLDTKIDHLCSSEPKLRREPTTDVPPSQIQKVLQESATFSDDMLALYNCVKLNELSTRLRFISAHQVETAFKGLFPFCSVLPFGSSINGFGKINSDLDLVLSFDGRLKHEVAPSRLIFHSKSLIGTSRMHNQRHLETVADVLQYFLPGCNQVKRILRARVPILRYKQDITGIDCDLSSVNLSGVYMSELLYMFGTYDWRVCPLVFTVRYWAKEVGLTNPAPGRWITNFSLTLLVLFYLQYEKIIPTLETLIKHKRPEDTRSFDDVDCSFLRDLKFLPEDCTEEKNVSLVDLLHRFFQFYSSFDFGSYAISLNSGTIIPKPEYSALYIVNPLEKYLNVSKNVSPEECERIRMQFRGAAWNMECSLGSGKDDEKWGLLDLINSHILNRSSSPRKGSLSTSRFTVQELFNENAEPVKRKKSKNQPT